MKQTFVVPIYKNDPNKYLTKVVKTPLNSKRIARVYAQSLSGLDIFTDQDLVGISIEENIVIPNNFPITAMCASYNHKEYMYIAGLGSNYSHLTPSIKALELGSYCSGSKLTIEYKTKVSDFVLIFECDDEAVKETFNYHIHNITLSYPNRFRGGLEDRYSKINFNILLQQKPVSFLVRPIIYSTGDLINYYHIYNEAYLLDIDDNPVCTFYEYLLRGLISIETGDNYRVDNMHIAIANPMAKLQFSDVEIGIKTQSQNLRGFIQFYKTQENNLYEQPPLENPFESAGYQIIIKTVKQ